MPESHNGIALDIKLYKVLIINSYMDFSKLSQLGLKARWEKKHQPIKTHIKDSHKNLLKEKARIIGLVMGDGSLNSIQKSKDKIQHHDITFYPDDLDLAKTFIKDFQKLYLKKPKIRKKRNYYSLRVSSKPAWEDLRKLGEFNSLNWCFPARLSSNMEKREWMKAMFDCESFVDINKKRISLQSVSKKGIDSIKKLLGEFKINSKIYQYTRNNPNWNINYILFISGKENITKFSELIGFNHKKKQKNLKLIASVPER